MLAWLPMVARGQTELDAINLSWLPQPTTFSFLRYWFDGEVTSVQTQSVSSLHTLDVSDLSDGLHTLYCQVVDNTGRVAYVRSGVFLKMDISETDETAFSSLRYWFDDEVAGVQTKTNGGLHLLDVSDLSDGLHTLYCQVVDNTGRVAYVKSGVFLKMGGASVSEMVKASKLLYWFDDETVIQQTDVSGDVQMIDASGLEDGLHTIHYQVLCNNGQMTPSSSSIFLRMAVDKTAVAKSLRYWFDDEQTATETAITDGIQLLDASRLTDGLHTVHYQIANSNGTLGAPASSIFLKMNSYDPESTTAQSLRYWFDDDTDVKTTSVSGGTQSIDVSNLLSGLHTLHYQLVDSSGQVTSPVSCVFMKSFDKAIADGENRITKYQYWLNRNSQAMQRVELASAANPYTLISLLPVQKEPIRSSSFHFEVPDGVPTIYAQNDLHIRFHDAHSYFVDDSKTFIDYSVKQEVTDITLLESDIRATTDKPSENAIKWYYLEAERGDSLQFKLDRAATVQLFAPSGEEIYHVSGSESVRWGGCHATESGVFYLALHDVTAQRGTTVSIDYKHIDKFAVLAIDIDEIGLAPSIVPMTIHGNGFDRLKSICLSLDGDTIRSDYRDVLDKATVTAMFTLQGGEKLGAYDLTLEFEDEEDGTVRMAFPERIHLARPVWGEVIVDVATARSLATPYPVHITVENTGNVVRLYTPLTIAFDHPELVNQVNFENFFVSKNRQNEDYDPVVWTDNFAGTGQRAESMYLFIQTLAPGEKKDLTMSLDASSHAKLNVFAEAGNSANDKNSVPQTTQKDKDKEEGHDGDTQHSGTQTGQEGTTGGEQTGQGGTSTGNNDAESHSCTITPSLWEYMRDHTDFGLNDDLLDNLGDLDLPGLAGRIVERLQQVRDIHNNAVGVGRMIGNIVNGLRLQHYMAVADSAGVDDEMRETLRNSVHLELPSDILNDAGHPILGAMAAYWEWQQLRSQCSGQRPTAHPVEILNAGDPNDILGYVSESGSKYMKEGTTDVYYTIEFENDPEIATAAAHTIVVKDTLDAQRFDLSTFAATSIRLGNRPAQQLGGVKSVDRMTIDLRPETYVIAQVSLSFDERKGIATWTIESLDPMTMEPTEDAMQGVLPVNHNGDGQGELTFDIKLKPGMVEGESVGNRAGIVFDYEEAILTPTWVNTVDAVAPASTILGGIQRSDSTLTLRLAGEDERSGVWKYSVYAQMGDGASWEPVAENTTDTLVDVRIYDGIEYGFLVLATDSAGNAERKSFEEADFRLTTVTPGDANGDGTVDALDVVLVTGYYLGNDVYLNLAAADVNADGEVNSLDVVAIQNIYLNATSGKALAPRKRARNFKRD